MLFHFDNGKNNLLILDEGSSYGVVMSYLQKYVFREIRVKTFDMITSTDEVKVFAEYISCDFKCKFNSTKCYSNQ